MELVRKYLDKVEQHIFSIEGKNIRKKIFPVEINGKTIAIMIFMDDDNDSTNVSVFDASMENKFSSKNKEYIEPFLKHFQLFDSANEGKHYSFKGGSDYALLVLHLRKKIEENEDEFVENSSIVNYRKLSSFVEREMKDHPALKGVPA